MRRSVRLVSVALGSLFLIVGSFLFLFYFETVINPGGPTCAPHSSCPISPWYESSTHNLELGPGAALLASGVVLLSLYLIARRGARLSGAFADS